VYYPKNQIETNLYSSGDLLVQTTTQPYYGFYFRTSNEQYFSGKEPNDGENFPLIKPLTQLQTPQLPTSPDPLIDFRFFPENEAYSVLTKQPRVYSPYLPSPYFPIPTKTDILNKQFQRYFAKKSNENVFTEISLEGAQSGVSSKLYLIIVLPWVIRGDLKQVSITNFKSISFTEKKFNVLGLDKFLKSNYREFYQG
tara:strand:+ start:3513 stop:4103 length:591 start_codon:yes stop_codon:yes gene_type:complete